MRVPSKGWTLVSLFVFACFAQPAQSQQELRTLHVLIVADVLASGNIGESCRIDGQTMQNLLYAGIPEHRVKIKVLTGTDVRKEKVIEYYRALPVGPEDGVLFYYAGHGEMRGAAKEHYLRFSQDTVKDFSRTRLRQEMQARGPGLVVILTDCCSSDGSRGVKGTTNGPLTPITTIKAAYRNLFFTSRGLVDITGADDGNDADGDNTNGGYFTHAFKLTLQAADSQVRWPTFYTALKRSTWEVSKKEQTSRAFHLPGLEWGLILDAQDRRLVVQEVLLDGAARRAGLVRNDLFVHVNDRPVTTPDELRIAINGNQSMQVVFRRGDLQLKGTLTK